MAVNQVAAFSVPVNGQANSAADVLTNDNAIRTQFNLLVTATDTLASSLTIVSPTVSTTVYGTPTFASATTLNGGLTIASGTTLTGTGATFIGIPQVLAACYANQSGTTPQYLPLGGTSAADGFQATENGAQIPIPVSGTIGRFWVLTNNAAAANGCTLTVRKNSATTSLVVYVTISAVAGSFSNTSDTFSVAPGDKICVQVNVSGGGVCPALQGAAVVLTTA